MLDTSTSRCDVVQSQSVSRLEATPTALHTLCNRYVARQQLNDVGRAWLNTFHCRHLAWWFTCPQWPMWATLYRTDFFQCNVLIALYSKATVSAHMSLVCLVHCAFVVLQVLIYIFIHHNYGSTKKRKKNRSHWTKWRRQWWQRVFYVTK